MCYVTVLLLSTVKWQLYFKCKLRKEKKPGQPLSSTKTMQPHTDMPWHASAMPRHKFHFLSFFVLKKENFSINMAYY